MATTKVGYIFLLWDFSATTFNDFIKMKKKTTVLLLLVLWGFTPSVFAQNTVHENLRFVTWNIEHLAENNEEGCVARNDADYLHLREFASTLDADIVALQEVESAEAVARVFPSNEWDIVMSDRPSTNPYDCRGSGRPSTQQKVGIAIKKGIEYEALDSFKELALGNPGLRYGVIIRLTGTPEPIDVMAVHLKSGCFVEDYSTSDRSACETFEEQVPLLDNWVEQKVKDDQAFVIMGDFNHRLTSPNNRLWFDLTEMDNQPIEITSNMENIQGCHPRYPDPIDHVLLGPNSSSYYVEGSETNHFFSYSGDAMTEDDMLSDHCPVSLQLSFKPSYPISSAVQWTQNSAEYNIMTSFLYQQAAERIDEYKTMDQPWVVYMDVDETLLDNSGYNKQRDMLGLGFTPESWETWVQQESAGIVPGSKAYVSKIIEAGGQIALITNRERTMDEHTWNNLIKLGYPLTRANTCIMGRTQADKDAVGKDGYINDKDLRRNQIKSGEAESCWAINPDVQSSWNRSLTVVMQIGDNIKDFEGTTQENVNMDAFLQRQGIDILILPNAMYGSWD